MRQRSGPIANAGQVMDHWEEIVADPSIPAKTRKAVCRGFVLSANEGTRRDAMVAFTTLATEQDLVALAAFSVSPSWYVRSEVAECLGQFTKSRQAQRLLEGLLTDRNSIVRRDAGEALGGFPQAVDCLKGRLKVERNSLAQCGIVYGLLRLGCLDYRERMIGFLRSEDRFTRSSTLAFLEDLCKRGDQETVQATMAAIEALIAYEDVFHVRRRAVDILQSYRG